MVPTVIAPVLVNNQPVSPLALPSSTHTYNPDVTSALASASVVLDHAPDLHR